MGDSAKETQTFGLVLLVKKSIGLCWSQNLFELYHSITSRSERLKKKDETGMGR